MRIIKPSRIFGLFMLIHAFAFSQITGTIKDKQTAETLPGVAIRLKGSNTGTASDVNGNFNIFAKPLDILVFSSVGYDILEVTLGNGTKLDIGLSANNTYLDQVVVVGYGTQKKIDLTGSIVSIKGEDLAKQSSQNAVSSLQGKAAGIQITNSGGPGSSPQVRIRGTATAQGNASPLYVVDGVFVNDLSFLNPADIESMEVLKDASSASIYGIRAANGVILVNTKKGTVSEPRLEYSGFTGAQITTNKVPMASGNKYGFLINEKLGSAVIGGTVPNTDWFGQILRPYAQVNNHQLSLSGGSEISKYTVSLSYLAQEGVVKNHQYDRLTARLQNDIKASKFLSIGYNAIYYNYKTNDIPGGIFYQAYVAPPLMVPKKSDGTYGDPKDVNLGNFANPLASLDWFNQKSKGQSLTGNVFAQINLHKNLFLKSSLGFNNYANSNRGYTSQDTLTTVQYSEVSRFNKGFGQGNMLLFENTLNYNKTYNKLRLGGLLGYGMQRTKNEYINGSTTDVPYTDSESTFYINTGNVTTNTIGNGGDLSTVLSYFGRLNTVFDEKYMLNASLRRDGSSKFPAESRFDIFPSVGLGWLINREGFMTNLKNIDELKLKGSWGRLGNANIPSNITTLTADYGAQYTTFFGNQPRVGGSIINVVPPTLLWEIVEETDLGFELAALNNRLFVESSVYNKATKNAIFSVPILGTQGSSSSSILGNYASFENKGLEVVLQWRDGIKKTSKNALKYNVGFNIAFNKNAVTAIKTGDVPQYGGGLGFGGYLSTIAKIGSPIGAFYGYDVAGIFQNQSEVDGSAQKNAKPGDFRFVDQNKDNVIDTRDKIILGNPNPRVLYGLNTSLDWRKFDLQFDVQGIAGVELYNGNKGKRFGNENYTADFYTNRWHGEGTSNTYPSAYLNGSNLDPNAWYVEKGDYIRIRNAQIGYSLTSDLLKKIGAKKMRVYLNAQNPFTFFKYLGFTPEISGSPMNAGIDLDIYPLSSTYNFGLNLSF